MTDKTVKALYLENRILKIQNNEKTSNVRRSKNEKKEKEDAVTLYSAETRTGWPACGKQAGRKG